MKFKNIKYKKFLSTTLLAVLFVIFAQPAFAHVVVKPSKVGIGSFQTFTVGVPVERDIPTTSLRLVIPEGLQHVTPNVKPGWTIEVKTEAEGMKGDVLNTGRPAPRRVTEIIWRGGSIPPGQRDEFIFSTQAPAEEAKLLWKAYQTYEDGTVVSWDQDPNVEKEASDDHEDSGPASQTLAINDLQEAASVNNTVAKNIGTNSTSLTLSIVAIALSIVALVQGRRKK